MSGDEESKVYTVQDIQTILKIGRSAAYEYVAKVYENKAPFRVLRIGKSYRIPRESFDSYIRGDFG